MPSGVSAATLARTTTGLTGLVGAIARKNRARRLKQDLHIQHRGPHSRILQVQTNHLVKRGLASAVHLPEAGDPRPRFEQAPTMPNVVGLNLVRNRRTRSNQGHLALQNVPELGNFIQTGTPHDLADPRDARIVGDFVGYLCVWIASRRGGFAGDELLNVFLVDRSVRRNVHRTKLQKLEGDAVSADTLLAEKYWTLGRQFHHSSQQQEHRRQENQSNGRP